MGGSDAAALVQLGLPVRAESAGAGTDARRSDRPRRRSPGRSPRPPADRRRGCQWPAYVQPVALDRLVRFDAGGHAASSCPKRRRNRQLGGDAREGGWLRTSARRPLRGVTVPASGLAEPAASRQAASDAPPMPCSSMTAPVPAGAAHQPGEVLQRAARRRPAQRLARGVAHDPRQAPPMAPPQPQIESAATPAASHCRRRHGGTTRVSPTVASPGRTARSRQQLARRADQETWRRPAAGRSARRSRRAVSATGRSPGSRPRETRPVTSANCSSGSVDRSRHGAAETVRPLRRPAATWAVCR